MTREEREQIEEAARAARDERGDAGNVRVRCPVCFDRTGKADYRRSLSLDLGRGLVYCHKCQVRGRLRGYASEEEPESAPVARPAPERPGPVRPLDTSYAARPYAAYARSRGLGEEWWAPLQVGYVPITDDDWRLAGRIVIPVLDAAGEWIGYSARRVVGDRGPKYRNAYLQAREATLWNIPAEWGGDEPLLVVEGVWDAVRYLPHALALLGKPSPSQVDLLARIGRPIVVALDGDAWEEGAALAAALTLRGAQACYIRLPPAIDPGQIAPEVLADAARVSLAYGSAEIRAAEV